MSARDDVLARIRAALADVPAAERPEDVEVPRNYRRSETADPVRRFVERVIDYGASVQTVETESAIAERVAAICEAHDAATVAVPRDLPRAWLPSSVAAVDDSGLDVAELDRIGAALTGCALAIGETGTIAFDGGPGQGRRALTLVPDLHVCVVFGSQVVDGVPSGIRRLAEGVRGERRPVTFVSGPSATSDIEFSRVEGVHGPRRLELVLVIG